jgi:hypothetical protein
MSSSDLAFHALASDPAAWHVRAVPRHVALPPRRALLRRCRTQHALRRRLPVPGRVDTAGGGDLRPLCRAPCLRHDGVCVMSRVVETDASSAWFLGSPFRVDALVQEGFTASAPIALANLSLSWILLDPSTDRAVKASSQRPVAVDRKWLTGNMVVRFGLVLGGQRLGSAALQKAKEQVGYAGPRSIVWAEDQKLFWRVIIAAFNFYRIK